MLLYEKYTPYTLNGIIGNGAAIRQLEAFGTSVQEGRKARPIMIYGPSGTGKTAAAHAFAYSNGFEIVELNSSDYRDSETLNRRIVPATKTRNLFNKTTLFLFDEIDELSKKFDSGAESVLIKIATTSRHPIIFIANDFWNQRISFLRNYVDRIEFRKPRDSEMLVLLMDIARKEGKKVGSDVLSEIVRRASGDVRGAINDLELMFDSKPELMEYMGYRERKLEIFSVLDKIFSSSNFDTPRMAVANSDVSVDMLINWVDENIPNRYTMREDLNSAYANLALASKLYGKAERTNYYGYLRYVSVLVSSGVSLSNSGRFAHFKPFAFPNNIRHLSKTKKERDAMSKVAAKLMPLFHSSRKDIVNHFMPVLNMMIRRGNEEAGKDKVLEFCENRLGLDADDVKTVSDYYKFKG